MVIPTFPISSPPQISSTKKSRSIGRYKWTEDSEWHPQNDSQSDSQNDTQEAKNDTKNWWMKLSVIEANLRNDSMGEE